MLQSIIISFMIAQYCVPGSMDWGGDTETKVVDMIVGPMAASASSIHKPVTTAKTATTIQKLGG
jgi:hypothetical protein